MGVDEDPDELDDGLCLRLSDDKDKFSSEFFPSVKSGVCVCTGESRLSLACELSRRESAEEDERDLVSIMKTKKNSFDY